MSQTNASHDDLRHMQKVNDIVRAELAKPIDFDNVVDLLFQARSALAFIQGYTELGLEWGKQPLQSWEEQDNESEEPRMQSRAEYEIERKQLEAVEFKRQQLNERQRIDCESEDNRMNGYGLQLQFDENYDL